MKRIYAILLLMAVCLCIGLVKFFDQDIFAYAVDSSKNMSAAMIANTQKSEGVESGAKNQELGARSQEPGAKSQEPGAKSQEPGAKSQEPGVRSQEPGAKSQELGARSQEPGVGSQEPEVRSQKSGVGSEESGARSQESLDRRGGEIALRANDFEDEVGQFNLKGADQENVNGDDEEQSRDVEDVDDREVAGQDDEEQSRDAEDGDDREVADQEDDDDEWASVGDDEKEVAAEDDGDVEGKDSSPNEVVAKEDDEFDGDFNESDDKVGDKTANGDFDTELSDRRDLDDESYDEQFESDFEKEFAKQDGSREYSEEDFGGREDVGRENGHENVEKVVSAQESRAFEEIKSAYAKNDLQTVRKLHKEHPGLTSIEAYRALYAEMRDYHKSLRGREVQEQIKNWSQFLENYPQSVHAKFAESKLLFATGRYLYRISPPERQQSELLKGLPQNARDLVDLAVTVWKRSSAKSYSMLKSVQEQVSGGELHLGVRGLQYYLYLRDIRRNLQNSEYKMAMELKFEVSGEVKLDAYFLLQALENEILTKKELEEYEKALQLEKNGDYHKAFTILAKIKNQGNSFYQQKAATKINDVVEVILANGVKEGEQLNAAQQFSAAIEKYKALERYALSDEQQKLLRDKVSETFEMEFRSHYVAAQKFFKEKQYRKCLSAIVKAEKIYNGKPDIYLQELKKLIVDRVFKVHDEKIREFIDREQLVEAENYINKVFSQHDPGQEHRDNIAQYAEFIAIYPKIIEAYDKKEYAKCSEFCQRALRYYRDNARINKIYKFTIEESNTITRHINSAREAIHKGYIVRAMKELDYCEKISRTEMSAVDELKNTWFLQLAKKYNAKFIKDVMFFVKAKDRWILDMTTDTWTNLPFAKKVEVSRAYQEAYAVQDSVPVENTFTIPRKNTNDEDVGFEMVFVPPARFFMGSPSDEKDRFTDELRHIVVLDTAYWMGKYEVSVEQWEGVTGRKIHQLKLSDDKAESTPVSHVSWEDIRRHFLSRAHESFRLPTEAEWEYACRAGTQTRFYWGNDPRLEDINDYAWYNENTEKVGEPYVHEIASKEANHWGLYDMSGNMYEWCNDWSGPYTKGEVVNPEGPNKGRMRVYRGGLWFHDAKYCRSAARVSYYPDYRGYYIGFRLFRRHADHKIVIAHMDWVASSVVEKIMQRVIEKEFNIPVKFLPVSQNEVWSKLESGIVDIHPDVWLPNHQEMFNKYVEKQKSIYARLSYRNAFQGFYIPEYIADKYEIYHVRDLQGREDLFDLNRDGIGDIWVGEPGWLTSKINEVKVKSYQLNFDALTLYEREIIDIVRDQVLSRKPIVFYSWEPNPVVEWSTLRRLEEPKYDIKDWNFNQEDIENSKITCGYPEASVYVLASSHLKERHPQVFKFLMNWYFPIEELKDLMLKVESISKTASKLEIADIITTWMEENPSIKRDWLRGIR